MEAGAKANQAYRADIQQVGKLLKHMLDICGCNEQFEEVRQIWRINTLPSDRLRELKLIELSLSYHWYKPIVWSY